MFSNVEFFKDGTYESDDANYDGSYSIEGDRIKFSGVLVEPVTLSYKIDGESCSSTAAAQVENRPQRLKE